MQDLTSILLPYQQKWISDPSPVKIWEKSRRIGATWCEAADAALTAGSASGQDVYYICYNEAITKEFIRDVVDWSKNFNLAAEAMQEVLIEDNGKNIKSFQVCYASGYRVTALTSRPTSLRGRQGILIADEWGFLENPNELLKAAMAFLMWGGKVRILSTHNGVDNNFNELVNDVRSGRKPYSLHRTTLDDALDQGLYKRICESTKKQYSKKTEKTWRDELIAFYGDGSEEELFCIPRQSGGCYFPRVLIEQCMEVDIPVLNLTLKDEFATRSEGDRLSEIESWCSKTLSTHILAHPHFKTSYGFDFGRSGDLSYLMVFQEQPDLVRKALFALELRNVPFKQQEQILFWIVDRLPRFIGGAHDARGNGQYLAEVAAQRYGRLRIAEVMLTNNWYLENMPKYKAALEDRKVVLPANSDLLDDHRAVEVIKGIPKVPDTRNKGTDGKKRHADGAIAVALAWYASCMDNGVGYPALGAMSLAG